MFKFKMLRKVLVAVFFYSLIIELNLNLCIAFSIDLSNPSHQLEPGKATSRPLIEPRPNGDNQLGADDQERGLGASFASRHSQATSSSSSTTVQVQPTTTTTTRDRGESSNTKQAGQKDSTTGGVVSSSWTGASQTIGSLRLPLVQALESNGRYNYFGRVRVGQQQVPFYVHFDLTSTRFWLPSAECRSELCLSRNRFQSNQSASFRPDELARRMDVAYDRGLSYKAEVVEDSVTLAGVTIQRQQFGAVSELQGELLAHMPVDGFLGLGFEDIQLQRGVPSNGTEDVATPVQTPFERLWRMGVLKEPIFSLRLKADVEQFLYSNDSGELLLGQLAADYTERELTYVPVSHANFWEFHLDGVALRSMHASNDLERGCESACPVILDTRYAFIGGHFSDVDRINKAMGAFAVGNGIYRLSTCDLGMLPYLVFSIGGREFLLAPDEYVDVQRIRGQVHACYSALVAVKSEDYPFWILGEYFLKRHYVVFDYGRKRLGFARSKTMTSKLNRFGQIERIMNLSSAP